MCAVANNVGGVAVENSGYCAVNYQEPKFFSGHKFFDKNFFVVASGAQNGMIIFGRFVGGYDRDASAKVGGGRFYYDVRIFEMFVMG